MNALHHEGPPTTVSSRPDATSDPRIAPATGLTTASDPLTFTFTASERDASLVPYEEMSVNSYSSSRDGKAMADRVIDGYYGKGNMY